MEELNLILSKVKDRNGINNEFWNMLPKSIIKDLD